MTGEINFILTYCIWYTLKIMYTGTYQAQDELFLNIAFLFNLYALLSYPQRCQAASLLGCFVLLIIGLIISWQFSYRGLCISASWFHFTLCLFSETSPQLCHCRGSTVHTYIFTIIIYCVYILVCTVHQMHKCFVNVLCSCLLWQP